MVIWSSWIVAEFARVRTEWIVLRAVRELTQRSEAERRLERSRAKVNVAIDRLSGVLTLVDYSSAPDLDVPWLSDPDDLPVFRTALAVGVPGILVTDNIKDFPVGQTRNGITMLDGNGFLKTLYELHPEANDAVAAYLNRRSAS